MTIRATIWYTAPLIICNITIEATDFLRKILPLQQLTVRWLRIISVDSQSLTLVDFGLVPSSPISQITISLLLTVKETKLWTNSQETPDKNRRQSTACLTVVESTRSLQVTVICSTVITLSWRVNQHQRLRVYGDSINRGIEPHSGLLRAPRTLAFTSMCSDGRLSSFLFCNDQICTWMLITSFKPKWGRRRGIKQLSKRRLHIHEDGHETLL